MSAPDYKMVSFDDWEALYCNGEKVLEGHRISVEDILKEMEVACEFKCASGPFLEEVQASGYVPDSLGEYPEDAFE